MAGDGQKGVSEAGHTCAHTHALAAAVACFITLTESNSGHTLTVGSPRVSCTCSSLQVNKYPSQRVFTAIGTGGDDFKDNMLKAVEAVVGTVHMECVSERPSSGGKYVSVRIGPVWVEAADQVRRAGAHKHMFSACSYVCMCCLPMYLACLHTCAVLSVGAQQLSHLGHDQSSACTGICASACRATDCWCCRLCAPLPGGGLFAPPSCLSHSYVPLAVDCCCVRASRLL